MAQDRNRIMVTCAWCKTKFSIQASDAKKRQAKTVTGELYHNRSCAAFALNARRKQEREQPTKK
jgi:hypothetical protein